MRDLSLKFLLFPFLILVSTAAFAENPSARFETRMAYDPTTTHMILFGGATATDRGTKVPYYLSDTWEWDGSRWIPRYPKNVPPARSGHVMVTDTNRNQILMFGGHNTKGDLNDTWVFKNGDWTEVATPNTPPARQVGGGAFDPVRDRLVLFGGTQTSADGKTFTSIYDTWEFDGTTWTQIGGQGPAVSKPVLAYDVARNQVIALALDSNANSLMYSYDAATGTWVQVKPATLPPCVNEGMATYQASTNTVLYTGGVCASSATNDVTYEWDGTNWTADTLLLDAGRVFGAALAYDANRSETVMFGGTPVASVPRADTYVYASGSGSWLIETDSTRPGPRSVFTFTADPENNTIWMYGGTTDVDTFSDFWRYDNGAWQAVVATGTPLNCVAPNAAFDTDRQKLVVVCADSGTAGTSTYEWDGTTWTAFTTLKTTPNYRRWSAMSYDATLKKTVLFGGLDTSGTSGNYVDWTWMWDGTSWTQQTHNLPPSRSNAMMWFDLNLKKTVMYGGIGRALTTDRVTRFGDMWTLDSTGWTQLTAVGTSAAPGIRYGAQVTIDPRSNHVLLFGGLRLDTVPSGLPNVPDTQVQVYASDMWEWDGNVWTAITPDVLPPARENGGMAWDATRNEIVLFGGFAGFYFSDLWGYTPTVWTLHIEDPLGPRRRVTR